MVRSRLLPLSLAVVIAVSAGGIAYAASGGQENGAEIATVLNAKTSIAQAVTTAVQKTGARALRVGLEKDNGTYLYEVTTISKNNVTGTLVDPETGKVVRSESQGIAGNSSGSEDGEEYTRLADSKITLAAAITTAEKQVGGKAVEAGFDHEDHGLRYEVEVAKDKAMHRVTIDGANGMVLAVKSAEDGEHGED